MNHLSRWAEASLVCYFQRTYPMVSGTAVHFDICCRRSSHLQPICGPNTSYQTLATNHLKWLQRGTFLGCFILTGIDVFGRSTSKRRVMFLWQNLTICQGRWDKGCFPNGWVPSETNWRGAWHCLKDNVWSHWKVWPSKSPVDCRPNWGNSKPKPSTIWLSILREESPLVKSWTALSGLQDIFPYKKGFDVEYMGWIIRISSCKFSCVLHPGSFRMPGLCLVFAGFASVFPTHKRSDMTNLEAATDGLPTPQAGRDSGCTSTNLFAPSCPAALIEWYKMGDPRPSSSGFMVPQAICQAKWLRQSEISLEVSLLSGRSCRLSMACNATVMDVLRKSREALNVDVSSLETTRPDLVRTLSVHGG